MYMHFPGTHPSDCIVVANAAVGIIDCKFSFVTNPKIISCYVRD